MMNVQYEDNVTFVTPTDDLQGEAVPALDTALEKLEAEGKWKVAVDLSNVGYIYSRGVGVLVKHQKLLKKGEGALYLICPSEKLLDLLKGTGLDKVMDIFTTRAEIEFQADLDASESSILGEGLTITVRKQEWLSEMQLSGIMDSEEDSSKFQETAEALLKETQKDILLDLEELIYLSDTSVNQLLEFQKTVEAQGGELKLTNPNEVVLDQLDVLKVKDNFTIVQS